MKLLLVYTGGTLGMVQSPEGDLSPFNFDEVLRQVPELNQLECDIETIQAWEPLDSSDINHNHWIKLADILNNNRDQYDGFVILHGTDTMAYTASALSFMLNNFSKPIILTGSQLPIGVLRSDGRENLITSIELAMARKNDETAIIKEVAVYFENKLFRGNRVYKRSSQAFEAFSSPNYPVLANVGVHIDINKQHTLAPVESYFCKNNLDPSVGILTLFPGIDEEISRALVLESKRNAIILHTYGSGNVPKLNWLPSLLDEAHEKGVMIINASQCRMGGVSQPAYASSRILRNSNVLSAGDMTLEATITKTMWLLGHGKRGKAFRELFLDDLAGERTL